VSRFLDLFIFVKILRVICNRLYDLKQGIFSVLFGVPEIFGAGGKYQKPPGGASARSEVSLRYEMYKAMVRYSQCS